MTPKIFFAEFYAFFNEFYTYFKLIEIIRKKSYLPKLLQVSSVDKLKFCTLFVIVSKVFAFFLNSFDISVKFCIA